MTAAASHRPPTMLRALLDSEALGGLVLMAAAALALVIANSPLAPGYFAVLAVHLGPLSLLHWINDGLMAVFFLFVGLEIKRELLDGQLSTWSRRVLPGIAAAGGMAVPALVYLAFNGGNPATMRGWAIPAATDIAFALGVLSLLGKGVPASLKVFLTALAILDDLGAVAIIAVFYTGQVSLLDLALAAAVALLLAGLNRGGVTRLWPYLLLGAVLWFFVLQSGVHGSIAGVVLALTIPLRADAGRPDAMATSPLHRLEHRLHAWVAFGIIPIFGFANAGVSFAGIGLNTLTDPLTLGVGLGLLVGKLVGVFGSAALAIRLGWADLPRAATWAQLLGVSLLCGIGFTMSLFIGMVAFAEDPVARDGVKVGIICGSVLAGVLGWTVLWVARRAKARPPAEHG